MGQLPRMTIEFLSNTQASSVYLARDQVAKHFSSDTKVLPNYIRQ